MFQESVSVRFRVCEKNMGRLLTGINTLFEVNDFGICVREGGFLVMGVVIELSLPLTRPFSFKFCKSTKKKTAQNLCVSFQKYFEFKIRGKI